MKRNTLLSLMFIALIFSGCNKYGFVSLNYPVSPAVVMPEKVKTIAIINRSLTKDTDKKNKIIESIVSSEVAGSDRIASDECLKAVFDGLNGYRGISIVIPHTTRWFGSGTGETPDLLDWKLVQDICDSNNASALLVLESFDSNSDLLVSTVAHTVGTIITGGTPEPSVPNQIKMNVVAFWRLYDPSTKTIIDQYRSTNYLTFNGTGTDLIIPPPEALPNTAYAAGQEYISRFLPTYYTVRRDLYKKGKGSSKQAFKAAFRSAEVANWQGAIDAWAAIAKNSSRKNAGRASLNIAVGYEVLGNTDLALQWATSSYEQYNDKLGREYSKILLARKNLGY